MDPQMWTYFGVSIGRAPLNSSGIRWNAWVNYPQFCGWLKADSKASMRELIRHYRGGGR